MIGYGRQSISQDDIAAVTGALRGDFLTQGKKVAEFEEMVSDYCSVKYAKAVCNGTAALHLAYLALGIKKNDIVWTVPNTFIATVNAARYCGAKVDFVDIDEKTYNLSIQALKNKLLVAKKIQQLPNLLVPVHFAGQSCQMADIWKLSQQYGFKIIEDASHALGGEYQNKKIGCCQYADAAVFSFHPVKMITTGEGGMVVTNHSELDEKVALLRTHGISKDKNQFSNQNAEDWHYEQKALGFNYRLTDIQAALGISQLKRLDAFVKRRRSIAKQYQKTLSSLPIILPYQHPETKSCWHLFVIQIKNRRELFQKLKKKKIFTQVHYVPANELYGMQDNTLINSQHYYQHCLSLPIYVDLSSNQQNSILKNINNFYV